MNLRSRIVLAVTVVFAGISLLAGLFMLNRAEKSLRIAFDRAIETRAEWLLSQVNVDPVLLPLPSESEKMRVSFRNYGQHRELFRSPGFPDAAGRGMDRNQQQRSYRSITVEVTPVQFPGGLVTLSLGVPDDSLTQDNIHLRWVFGLSWLISLGLAFGCGYIVAGWLLKPIQTIVNQASQITNTTTIESIALPNTRDELYQLTDTLNQMLSRIQESAELQRNFFGAAAHELRTPLSVMKTGLEVTLNSNQVDSQARQFLTGQLDEVRRLHRLLDEFLTLSRPDNRPYSFNPSAIDLSETIKKCLAQLESVVADYDVDIQLTEENPLLKESIWIDGTKLEHVLLNLLENAIKYAQANSVITVQLSWKETPTIQIENQTMQESGAVADLMQPYFRADPLKEGHGLGLWVSYRLTTLLGGQLYLRWEDFTFSSTLFLPQTK